MISTKNEKTMSFKTLLCFVILVNIAETNSPPKLEEFKPKRYQNIKTKFSLFCFTNEGTKPIQFEWRKNGHHVQNNSNSLLRIETSEDRSVLLIEQLSLFDSGNYSCQVRNDFGHDSQFTLLTVKGLSISHFVFTSICGASLVFHI